MSAENRDSLMSLLRDSLRVKAEQMLEEEVNALCGESHGRRRECTLGESAPRTALSPPGGPRTVLEPSRKDPASFPEGSRQGPHRAHSPAHRRPEPRLHHPNARPRASPATLDPLSPWVDRRPGSGRRQELRNCPTCPDVDHESGDAVAQTGLRPNRLSRGDSLGRVRKLPRIPP